MGVSAGGRICGGGLIHGHFVELRNWWAYLRGGAITDFDCIMRDLLRARKDIDFEYKVESQNPTENYTKRIPHMLTFNPCQNKSRH